LEATILFDGDCGFCRRAVAWVLARDREARLEAVPFQEAPSPPMSPALEVACRRAVHVVRSDGGILRAGRAVLFILERTGMPLTARLLSHRPFLWIVELAYLLVARNRSFFGRFLFRP
jgi:predicted DCC family thiol-disulfide oxidoreductase YuxK